MKYVLPATSRHARHVAAFLRPADALEVRLVRPDLTPEECLLDSLRLTPQPMAVFDDGVPCGIFGVGPQPENGYNVLWMVGTPLLTSKKVEFLRGMTEFLDWYLGQYSDLPFINQVHHTNTLHIRWLQYLGAEVGATQANGFRGFVLNVRNHFRGNRRDGRDVSVRGLVCCGSGRHRHDICSPAISG